MTTASETIKSKVQSQTTEMLKEMAESLVNDFSEGAGVVLVFVLDELESRMTEIEYAEFAESL